MKMINSAPDDGPSQCPQPLPELVSKRGLARRIDAINADADGVRADQRGQAGSDIVEHLVACGHVLDQPRPLAFAGDIPRAPRQPVCLSNRPFSRCQSRFFAVSRLSCSFLPRASASSTLARPFSLK